MINRMGFNNEGLEAFAGRLARRAAAASSAPTSAPTRTPPTASPTMSPGLTPAVGPGVDYFTINISSPNTPGLRALQTKAALEELLGRIAEARRRAAAGPAVRCS